MSTKARYEHPLFIKPERKRLRGAVALLLFLPVAAWAGGVVTVCTESALRTAMSGGGVVTFACDGTITLAATLTIEADTVLDATGRQITISGNDARRVFLVNTNVHFTVSNLTIAHGRHDNGAGIFNAGGHLTVQGCVFAGNTALGQAGSANSGNPGGNSFGGALFNAGVAFIGNSTFSTNMVLGGAGGSGTNAAHGQGGAGGVGGLGYGGAVYNAGELRLTNCTLNGNSATGGVGGNGGRGSTDALYGGKGGSGGVGGSGYGGALFNAGVPRLVNTTIAENAGIGGSGGSGGTGGGSPSPYSGDGGDGGAGGGGAGAGLYHSTGYCSLTNCTLAFSTAIPGGGGARGVAGSSSSGGGSPGLAGPAGSASAGGINGNGGPSLVNVLLASNAPANGSSGIVDGGHNLSSDNSCGFTTAGSLNNLDPLAGPLSDSGGSTLTVALMVGSPAIDAGDDAAAPPADQRGVPRPVGLASDIGAYENGPPATLLPPQSQSVAVGATVDFSVPVAGYPPLGYQWLFKGTSFSADATNPVLHLADVQSWQSGAYSLVITNAFGAVTSAPALLDVVFRTVTRCTEAVLRLAMAQGGTVTFACDGTILLGSTITNTLNTVLDASGHQVTISGGDAVRVFCVPTNLSLEIIALTIAHGVGRMGGGILNLGGRVSLTGAHVQANLATYEAEPQDTRLAAGGGILNQGGVLEATNCVFSNNETRQSRAPSPRPARDGGGALCNQGGYIRLQGCSFVSNSVAGPPGPDNTGGTAPEALGGAIANGGTLEASQCLFVANAAVGGVGGFGYCQGGGANGGAIANLGTLALRESTFMTNTASGGQGGTGLNGMGGSYPSYGGSGGVGGAGNGGGLFNAGAATVADCTFMGNLARGGSGGPGGAGGDNVYPPGHWAPGGDGRSGGQGGSACGAIFDSNALCLLTNCTVSFNSGIPGAGGPGGRGGFGNPLGSAGPAGPDGEALGSVRSIGAIVVNTLLTGNSPGGNCSGTFTDFGQNFSSDCSCAFTNNTPPKTAPLTVPRFYVVHNFTDQSSYSGSVLDPHPFAPLLPGPSDTVFGVTAGAAYPVGGAVFRVGTDGTDSSYSVLGAFSQLAGALARSGDVLFGATRDNVFRINTDGSGYLVLHTFTNTPDGRWARAGLALGGSTLYGTTSTGGTSGYGTVFRIETNGSGYSIIKHFQGGTNGSYPAAELVVSGTTLYGTTWGGGQTVGSTVFKINTDGNDFKVLKHFDAAISGAHPRGGLTLSGSTLFGTTDATCYGGSQDCGSVFRINTDGSEFRILKQFAGSDGPGSKATLLVSGGLVFGTAYGDGSLTNQGTVFLMNTDGSGNTILKQFSGMDGAGPNGALLLSGNTLYGTAENGGFYNAGVAFGLALSPPVIISLPPSQTVELGGDVHFKVEATGLPPTACQWLFNATNPVPGATNPTLHLEAVQFARSGSYTLVLTNALGAITSAPVQLNVVAPVERSLVQGIKVTGDSGSLIHLDYSTSLSAPPGWNPLGSLSLTNTWQYWFDDTLPLPPQRYYRAWQTGTPSAIPSLEFNMVPAITLMGNLGSSVRVDYINRFGPTDAWVTLDTVALTNPSQLYFDVSAPGQPPRLYRLVPLP